MKKLLYCALVAAALAVPTAPQELGKLKPVEVIKISEDSGTVLIETDTGDAGRGETVELALWDLKATTPGTIYLDTAEYLLLPEGREELLSQLAPHLKDSVRLCLWDGEVDVTKTGEFLDAHDPGMKLKEYGPGQQLKVLTSEKERLHLREK